MPAPAIVRVRPQDEGQLKEAVANVDATAADAALIEAASALYVASLWEQHAKNPGDLALRAVASERRSARRIYRLADRRRLRAPAREQPR